MDFDHNIRLTQHCEMYSKITRCLSTDGLTRTAGLIGNFLLPSIHFSFFLINFMEENFVIKAEWNQWLDCWNGKEK